MKPSYVQTVAPTVSPIELEDAKLHMRVSGTDEDFLIQGLIDAAQAYVQEYQWSQLTSATWEMRMDHFPPDNVILLHPNPVISITSVQYVDTGGTTQTLTSTTDYVTDVNQKPARIVPAYAKWWPITRWHINDVVVTFVAGYGATSSTIPVTTRQAILLLISHWYWNREATGMAAGEIEFAVKALLGLNSYRTFY